MSSFDFARTTNLIPESLTCFIPGRGDELDIQEKLSRSRGRTIIFMGSANTGKTSLMENCLVGLPTSSGYSNIFPAQIISLIQSLVSVQQVSISSSNRGVTCVTCVFDSEGKFVSASAAVVGLELSRLSRHGIDESDYFIFHDVFANVSAHLRNELQLAKLTTFAARHGNNNSPSDAQRFKNFQNILSSVCTSSEQINAFLRLIAGILHLREVRIFEASAGGRTGISDLTIASEMLGLSSKALLATIGVRRVNAGRRSSISETLNNVEQTTRCRDVLAKQLYRTAVVWCLKKLNDYTDKVITNMEISSALTFLDVPGYDANSSVNCLDSLCRNFMNEAIYHSAKASLFTKEEALCQSEGIGHLFKTDIANEISVPSDIMNLFMLPVRGLLPLLDVQTQLGDAASDKAYLSQTRVNWSTSSSFSKPRFGEDDGFVIKHFYGAVQYNVAGFVENNVENIHKTFANIESLLQQSANPILKYVYAEHWGTQPQSTDVLNLEQTIETSTSSESTETPTHTNSYSTLNLTNKNIVASTLMKTVMDQYRSEMMTGNRITCEAKILSSALDSCDHHLLHFVLCCSPNPKFPKSRHCDESWIRQQINAYHAEKAGQCRQYQYTSRIRKTELASLSPDMALVNMIFTQTKGTLLANRSRSDTTGTVLSSILKPEDFHSGQEWVFLRDGSQEAISAYANALRSRAVAVIQAFARRNSLRKRSATKIAAHWKAYRGKKVYYGKLCRIVALQAQIRRYYIQKQYKVARDQAIAAVTRIQAVARGRMARTKVRERQV